MKPEWFTDEFGQFHAWSYLRNHYIVGIGPDKALALARWTEAMKAAK